jgi:hypothetical protein
MNATVSVISIVFSGIMMVIGVITIIKSYGGSMAGQGRIEQKVNDIGSDVKEVRDDVKAEGVRLSNITERLATVEDSVKVAHHRIDEEHKRIDELIK